MKSLYNDITNDEYKTLEEILKRPNSSPVSFFFNDPTIDGRIQELEKAKLIKITDGAINITELGLAAIKEHRENVRRERRKIVIEVIKFIIPTLISLAALIVSIISLLRTTPAV